MNNIEEKIDNHEKRIVQLEISSGRMDERMQELVRATNNLKTSTWFFSLIMLLTIIYLLLGKQGYNDVTSSVGLPINKIQTATK